MKWNDLSMAERTNYIKLGLDNNITDLNIIKNTYNKYANGGNIDSDEDYYNYMEKLSDKKSKDWNENPDITLIRMLNDNSYNYKKFYELDRQIAEKMLIADSKAHFTDIGKTVYHPTFSNESFYSGKKSDYNPKGTIGGSWKGDNIYIPSTSQYKNGDFNYFKTREYLDRDDPKIKIDFRNILFKSANKYTTGGFTNTEEEENEDKVLSTGNSYADAALGFVPFVGSAMEIEDAIREPSLSNIGNAAFSVGTDLLGLSLLRGGVKAYRLAKAAKKAHREFKAISTKNNVSKAYKILSTPNLNPKKYETAMKTLHNSGAKRAFEKANKADNARIFYNNYRFPFINNSLNIIGLTGGFVQDATQFINSLGNNR